MTKSKPVSILERVNIPLVPTSPSLIRPSIRPIPNSDLLYGEYLPLNAVELGLCARK